MFKTLGLLAVCMTLLAVTFDRLTPRRSKPDRRSIEQRARQAVDSIQSHSGPDPSPVTVAVTADRSQSGELDMLASTGPALEPTLEMAPDGWITLSTHASHVPAGRTQISILLSHDNHPGHVTRAQAESLTILLHSLGRALTDKGFGALGELEPALMGQSPQFAQFLRDLFIESGFLVR